MIFLMIFPLIGLVEFLCTVQERYFKPIDKNKVMKYNFVKLISAKLEIAKVLLLHLPIHKKQMKILMKLEYPQVADL